MIAGPSGMCSRAGPATRGSWPKSCEDDRLAGGQHLAGYGGADREHQPQGTWRAYSRRMLDNQLLPVGGGQRQRDQVGARHFQRLLRDQGQHLIRGRAGQQPPGHLAAGPQPALLPAGLLVQLGVVDRHPGRRSQCDQQRLILLVEVGAALFLGQVEVAVDLVPDPHGNAEEAAHGRMPGREAARLGAGRDVRQPQRARVGDQRAEQAPAFRPVMDRRDFAVGQADRDELDQAPVVADDPERAVTGPDQRDRGLDDLLEHHLQVKVGADRDDRFEQRVDPVPGSQHGLQPRLELGEEIVQAQLRQRWMRFRRLHRLPPWGILGICVSSEPTVSPGRCGVCSGLAFP